MIKKTNNHLKQITQIGIVVKDLQKSVEGMERVFGVLPDDYGQTPNANKKYYGKEENFAAKMAFYRFANVEIEFVEPLYGDNIWNDFLNKGQFGLHHLRFSVNSYDGTIEEMQQREVTLSMEGLSVRNIPGLKWAYFDTQDEIGFVTEILNDLEIKA